MCCLFDWSSGRGRRKGEFGLGVGPKLYIPFNFSDWHATSTTCARCQHCCTAQIGFNQIAYWCSPDSWKCYYGHWWTNNGHFGLWRSPRFGKFLFILFWFNFNHFQSVLVNSGVHQISRECLWVSPLKYFNVLILIYSADTLKYCSRNAGARYPSIFNWWTGRKCKWFIKFIFLKCIYLFFKVMRLCSDQSPRKRKVK